MAASDASPDFAALLARARAGDDAALAELLRRYEPALRTEARVLLGPLLRPHLDSLDLVQTVHRTLLPGLRAGRFRLTEPPQLVALAVRVLRRKLSRTWRKEKRHKPAPDAAPPAPPDDDPLLVALSHDERDRALALLVPAERDLLQLLWQGWTPAEIAARTGADAHALRAKLSKLRKRLRDAGLLPPE